MAPGRLPDRFHIALLIAGVIAGVLLTATPRAGQQPPERQGSGTSVPRQGPGMPAIAVPRVSAPVVKVPVVNPSPAPVQAASSWMSAARAEAFVQAARLGLNYLPGEVLVKFKDGMGPAEQTRALQVLGARPTADEIEWAGWIAVVRDNTQPDAYILADQLKSQPEVEYAEPNFIATIDPVERSFIQTARPLPRVASPRPTRGGASINGIPTDTDYAAYQWNFTLINMPGAWDIQPGGHNDIIVAVIDTGITGSNGTVTTSIWTGSSFQTVAIPFAVNPDLPASRHALARDFVGSAVNPAPPLIDMDGHGTHVSGTIGEATNNAFLLSGIAYNVRIMPVKVCADYWDLMIARGAAGVSGFAPTGTFCAESDIINGIQYAADNGARVMNISLGGTSPDPLLQSTLAYAVSKGTFISISMGNEFKKGNPTMYPASYASGISGAISVASIGWNSVQAYYSSTGTYCEIAAPGGDVISGAGRFDGGAIWQSTIRPEDSPPSLKVPRFDGYDKLPLQGTSMAAPHVAGLAALIMSQMPNATPAQVEQIIRATAKDLGAVGRDDVYGYGLIQPRAAVFGFGLGIRR